MGPSSSQPIHGLHHNVWRCSDAERTRRFYEDLLGLPLTEAFAIEESKTGRAVQALHFFFRLGDGSSLAFFDVPSMPFDFTPQHVFALHIALRVDADALQPMLERAREAGVEVRGVVDHGTIHSIYLRDPDGYVVELTAPQSEALSSAAPASVRHIVDTWQARKAALPALE